MKPNKYIERQKEARRLFKYLYGEDGRKWHEAVQLDKPWWTGNYTFNWLPNEKHRSFPDFDVAMSLRKYLPHPIIYKRNAGEIAKQHYPKDLVYYAIQYTQRFISQEEYDKLTSQQKKFFSGNQEPWTWIDRYLHRQPKPILDRHGNRRYRFCMDVQKYFVPQLIKHKVTKIWVRKSEEPDYRKWKEKFWDSGFGFKYYVHKHHSDRSRRINPENHRKESRILLNQIQEGLEEWEKEKEGK